MVIALIVGQGDMDLVEVTVDTDGDAGDDTGTVVATDGHPFWVENLGAWVYAKDLRPGDMLRTSAGTWVQVQAVHEFQRHQRVYNLTVAGIHTYHVTTTNTDLLVHNTNKFDCEVTISKSAHPQVGTAYRRCASRSLSGYSDNRQGRCSGETFGILRWVGKGARSAA